MVTTFCVSRGLYGFTTTGLNEMLEYFTDEKILVTSHQDNKRLQG